MDTQSIRFGVLGLGNMASAIVDGLLYTGALLPENIYACGRDQEKLRLNTAKRGIHACRSAAETVDNADVVLVSVLPGQVEDVVKPLADRLEGRILISIAADYPCAKYAAYLPDSIPHISTIPNTPVSVGEGVIVSEKTHTLKAADQEVFEALFGQIGLIEYVDTDKLSLGGTLAGCTPAMAAMMIEALGDAGVKYGLSRAAAYRLAAQMMAGTGRYAVMSGKHPGELKDAVCSPGGTSILGVTTLEKEGFRGALVEAIDAIMARHAENA